MQLEINTEHLFVVLKMSDDDRLIEKALETVSVCLLPPLSNELDSNPLSKDNFTEFRCILDDQLHLLLDILYQNGYFLNEQASDNQLVQLRASLLLLACEQTEPNPFFQTEQPILINSLTKLIDDNLQHLNIQVIQKVTESYKESLSKERWKKQLGMVHGFPKFCEIILTRKSEMVDKDLILFILSVGSNLVAHFDPHYKTIGMKIYRHLMEHGNAAHLKELNIQQVVYSESFRMIRKCNEYDYNDHLYECLFQVVLLEDSKVEHSNWCKFDEVFDQLLEQFRMESADIVCALLIKKIVRFALVAYTTKTFDMDVEVEALEEHFETLMTATRLENLRTMRWIKKLQQMMVGESSKLLNAHSYSLLNAFHSIYVISMLNCDADTLEPQLSEFTMKIILILMQVVKQFKDDKKIMKSVKLFLNSIAQHQKSNQDLQVCIQKVFSHSAFC